MRHLLILLLVIVTACTRQTPPSAGSFVYRTTEGVRPLTWNLKIWNATKSQLLHEYTPANPGGLDGGFAWQLKPHGDTVTLTFAGRNDTLGIPPRGVVALTVDGNAAYYGIAPDVPSQASPDAEAVAVAGGREALRVTLMDGKVYSGGIYSMVRDILSRLCPGALTYDATLIGDGTGIDAGPTLDTFYSPTADLVTVLDGLAKSANTVWGVDASGRVFFGRPQPAALNVAYDGQPWRRLLVQGRETVTQAVLRVISAPSEGVTGYTFVDGASISYLPATVTKVATAPEHLAYLAQASFAPPEGISVVRDSTTGEQDSINMADVPLAFDGDPTTAAASTGTLPNLSLRNTTQRVIGVRLRYSRSDAANVDGQIRIMHADAFPSSTTSDTLTFPLPEASTPTEIVVLAPPSPALLSKGLTSTHVRVAIVRNPADATNLLSVYEMALIVVDEDTAQRVAESFLRVPFSRPAEVTLPGLLAPAQAATVTGSPDGDVTADAALFEYELTPENGRQTKVRLGSTGQDQTVRALKWAVRRE